MSIAKQIQRILRNRRGLWTILIAFLFLLASVFLYEKSEDLSNALRVAAGAFLGAAVSILATLLIRLAEETGPTQSSTGAP